MDPFNDAQKQTTSNVFFKELLRKEHTLIELGKIFLEKLELKMHEESKKRTDYTSLAMEKARTQQDTNKSTFRFS
jgi:hypothetical protein